MDELSAFVAEIEAFLDANKMKPTQFGKAALGDPNFVRDLREKGRAPSFKTADRVRAFIRSSQCPAPEQGAQA